MGRGKTFYAPNSHCVTLWTEKDYSGKSMTYCADSSITCKGAYGDPGEYKCVVSGQNDEYVGYKRDDGIKVQVWDGTYFENDRYGTRELYSSEPSMSWLRNSISSLKVQKDCNDKKWIWDQDCKDNKKNTINAGSDQMQANIKSFCNESEENAFSTNCVTWCEGNPDACVLKKRYDKCDTYGISGDCTDDAITKLEGKCVSMGFIDNTTKTSLGGATCTISGVDSYLKKCKTDFNLSESECTVANYNTKATDKVLADRAEEKRLSDEKQAELTRKKIAEENAKLIAEQKKQGEAQRRDLERINKEQKAARKKQSEETEKTLLSIVDPDFLPEDLKKKQADSNLSDDNTIYYIIFFVIICILVMSSSSLAVILSSSGEE
jgi:hypothetical protein